MAKTVSLINMKGGVGKTTLTVNLAWYFSSQRHMRVLVVDLDPQCSASQYLVGGENYQRYLSDGKPTVWEIFEQNTRTPTGVIGKLDPHDAVRNVVRNDRTGHKIDLLPSRFELALSLKSLEHKVNLLQRSLRRLDGEYDLVLIDCAPTESVLTTAAYLASQHILVPVRPEHLSAISLPLLANSIKGYLQQYDEAQLELAGVIFNNATSLYSQEEQISKEVVRKIAASNGWYVFKSEIVYSQSYPRGVRERKPVFLTDSSRATVSENFCEVASEFARRIDL